MFSVRPRYWPAIIRANAVDIIMGVSIVIFMINTSSGLLQLIWAAVYAVWLVLIKPGSTVFGISMQALLALVFGLSAVYLEWGASEGVVLMIMTWLICYSAARHFFTSFDESHPAFWLTFGHCLVPVWHGSCLTGCSTTKLFLRLRCY